MPTVIGLGPSAPSRWLSAGADDVARVGVVVVVVVLVLVVVVVVVVVVLLVVVVVVVLVVVVVVVVEEEEEFAVDTCFASRNLHASRGKWSKSQPLQSASCLAHTVMPNLEDRNWTASRWVDLAMSAASRPSFEVRIVRWAYSGQSDLVGIASWSNWALVSLRVLVRSLIFVVFLGTNSENARSVRAGSGSTMGRSRMDTRTFWCPFFPTKNPIYFSIFGVLEWRF